MDQTSVLQNGTKFDGHCLAKFQPVGSPCLLDEHCDSICDFTLQICAYPGTLGSICRPPSPIQCGSGLFCHEETSRCTNLRSEGDICRHDFECLSGLCKDKGHECVADLSLAFKWVFGVILSLVMLSLCLCCIIDCATQSAKERENRARASAEAGVQLQQIAPPRYSNDAEDSSVAEQSSLLSP